VCEDAKYALLKYLDALEEYDRVHLMLLAACRANDAEAAEGYRVLVREAKLKLRAARERFQEHQKAHNCCDAIRLEEEPEQ